ncbi:FGGY-family carbohydrate kinase (plasmid) [Entomospira entomophila]|uniref:Sugar kinase n=1 Tax=Entomospira entomophila TaxID=2719988 RepID=A0A968GB69_9SPIO|nr:FGGY-family carbohydrate kinase [Entomospira entomophilus]NIZ41317.1 sugar kinase [Entomospira entomophilus]WDI36270.1 FGGY-family carbohydrate kinase [Entomospira entomophilus]
MSEQYLMGIDGGTQSTKVIIVNKQGHTVAQASKNLKPMHTTAEGVAEHPNDDLFDSLIATIKQALKQFQGSPDEIQAIGLGSIRYCRCLLQRDGTLAQPVISWMDKRIATSYNHTNPEVAYVTATTGYLMGRLTNNFTDTIANCIGQWPIDTEKWQVIDDPSTIETHGLSKAMMYELKMPGEVGGYLSQEVSHLTGLPAGIPVAHTANDKAVEALGAGLQDQSTVLLSLGTYIASMVIGHHNITSAQSFWTNMACQPYQYLYESNGIRRGMWTVSWLKSLLGQELVQHATEQNLSLENYLNKVASHVSVGSDGLMCILDWLAPPNQPHKKGMFIGFDQRHSYPHIYRSILEGIALTMYNHTSDMLKELKITPKELVVTGGGSHSDLFMQILADTFNMPAYRTENDSIAGLGAAIAAAVASKVYPSFSEAIKHMVHRSTTFYPIKEHVLRYQQINIAYRNLIQESDTILQHLHQAYEGI